MPSITTIGLIRASLPRYFPERYGVWERAEKFLETLCADLGVRFFATDGVSTNSNEAQNALRQCESMNADFVLLLHGGFTMGDVGREVAASRFRLGVWSVPEPARTGDVQLNNFVSLNMTMSVARLVRDVRKSPVQWYHCEPGGKEVTARLSTTLRAIKAVKAVENARVGVVGGLAPTFYNMEISTNLLRQRLGVAVVAHDMHELTSRMAAIPMDRVENEIAKMKQAAGIRGVSKKQMKLTARAALALSDIAFDADHDALAVSDWPALQADPGMHPGSAFSWLEENDALPCGSEGDVLGAVTQLVSLSVTGRLGTLLDMTEPDFESGRLLMWHCGGGPLHMADSSGAEWINHPMIGREDPKIRSSGASRISSSRRDRSRFSASRAMRAHSSRCRPTSCPRIRPASTVAGDGWRTSAFCMRPPVLATLWQRSWRMGLNTILSRLPACTRKYWPSLRRGPACVL